MTENKRMELSKNVDIMIMVHQGHTRKYVMKKMDVTKAFIDNLVGKIPKKIKTKKDKSFERLQETALQFKKMEIAKRRIDTKYTFMDHILNGTSKNNIKANPVITWI